LTTFDNSWQQLTLNWQSSCQRGVHLLQAQILRYLRDPFGSFFSTRLTPSSSLTATGIHRHRYCNCQILLELADHLQTCTALDRHMEQILVPNEDQ
jgi:hypothetical protein